MTNTAPCSFTAYLFDLDGVLTPTAEVHMAAWSQLFNGYLTAHGLGPAYTARDYFDYVDGKPRYAGVQAFLSARGIDLPYGDPSDSPDTDSVCGLGNRKNAVFSEILRVDGVAPYPGSVLLLDALAKTGTQVAVVSSSRNATAVLAAAGLADRFEVVVDGVVAENMNLPGKPAPDTYAYAARLLGVDAAAAVVVEDALSGVASGRAGNFGLVLGVDRGAGAKALLDAGADVVVTDLAELIDDSQTVRLPESFA